MSKRPSYPRKLNLTSADLYYLGFRACYTTWERGYLSRKTDPDDYPAYIGRHGVYLVAPAYNSTNYRHRVYLKYEPMD